MRGWRCITLWMALLTVAVLTAVPTAPGLPLRLSFSAPVLTPRDHQPEQLLRQQRLMAGPDAVYHNEGMPPIRSGSLRPLSAVQLDDGTIVQASITCFVSSIRGTTHTCPSVNCMTVALQPLANTRTWLPLPGGRPYSRVEPH